MPRERERENGRDVWSKWIGINMSRISRPISLLVILLVSKVYPKRILEPLHVGETNGDSVDGSTHEIPAENQAAMRKNVVDAARGQQFSCKLAVQLKGKRVLASLRASSPLVNIFGGGTLQSFVKALQCKLCVIRETLIIATKEEHDRRANNPVCWVASRLAILLLE